MNDRHMTLEQVIDGILRLKSPGSELEPQGPGPGTGVSALPDVRFISMLLDTIPTGVSIIDANDLHYIVANRRAIEILGLDPTGRALDDILDIVNVYRPDGRTPYAHEELPVYQAIRTGEAVRHREMIIEQSNGRRLNVLVNCTPYRDESGAIRMLVTGFMDVTRMKAAERYAHDSLERSHELVKALEKANRDKNRYLNMLSHELRNPLAAIVLGQSLLRRLPSESDQARRTLDTIERQTAQLTRLVDDLLDVTRINDNRIRLKKEAVDLVEVIRETMADFDAQFMARHVTYRARLPMQPIVLSIDRARLSQALGNILHNALKFTNEGDDVLVTVGSTAEHIIISVKDTGIGIAPSLLPDMFMPFAQEDTSLDRRQGGLGLGLAIAKGLIALHGGTIEAFSEGVGRGAEFIIRLPLTECRTEAGQCLIE